MNKNKYNSRLKTELKNIFKYIPKNDNFFSLPNDESDAYNEITNSSSDTSILLTYRNSPKPL